MHKESSFTVGGITMVVSLWKFTPEMCVQLLQNQAPNRTIRTHRVRKIQRCMENDIFVPNGQTIIIDKNGQLQDGQHRLHACLRSQKGFISMVVLDVDPKVTNTIDTGSNRILGDTFVMGGVKSSGVKSRVARFGYLWENFLPDIVSHKGFTKNMMLLIDQNSVFEYYQKHKQEIDYCCSLYDSHSMYDIIFQTGGATLAFSHLTLNAVDRAKAQRFFDAWLTGKMPNSWRLMEINRQKILNRSSDVRLTESSRLSMLFGLWNILIGGCDEKNEANKTFSVPLEFLRKSMGEHEVLLDAANAKTKEE